MRATPVDKGDCKSRARLSCYTDRRRKIGDAGYDWARGHTSAISNNRVELNRQGMVIDRLPCFTDLVDHRSPRLRGLKRK